MIFGILLEILINLKGTSVVISTVFAIDWKVAAIVGIVCVLTYSYFGGLWTSVMTGTLNTLMVTVPAAIVVAAVYEQVPGGAPAVFDAVGAGGPAQSFGAAPGRRRRASASRWLSACSPPPSRIRPSGRRYGRSEGREVARTFFWAGALFYPIPICLGMLGLVGIAFGLTPADIGGDIAAVGPYIVSHIGLPLSLVILYVLVILAACYSTIDGASAALSSIVAVDIVKRYLPADHEKARSSSSPNCRCCSAALVATAIVLSGIDFTTLVLTTYALKTSILLPLVLAILWPRTNTVGFVGGVVLAILIGMPIYETQGELIGTLSIVAISGLTVVTAGFFWQRALRRLDPARVTDDIASGRRGEFRIARTGRVMRRDAQSIIASKEHESCPTILSLIVALASSAPRVFISGFIARAARGGPRVAGTRARRRRGVTKAIMAGARSSPSSPRRWSSPRPASTRLWIYAGPLLAIVTATGVGVAFFVGQRQASASTAAVSSRRP